MVLTLKVVFSAEKFHSIVNQKFDWIVKIAL